MQRIRIERKAPRRSLANRHVVLPLDPRDSDILRAKLLLGAVKPVRNGRREN
jgi:hypothetical protein